MGTLIDLTGQVFGRLTVLERGPNYIKSDGRTITRWWCICKCGNKTLIQGGHLKHGTQSCGCIGREMSSKRATNNKGKYRLSARDVTINLCLSKIRCRARKKGLELTLTKQDIGNLIFLPCYYCGTEPSNNLGKTNTLPYQGLDRVDSNKGYTLNNVVPCCFACNRDKGDRSASWFKRFRDFWAPIMG